MLLDGIIGEVHPVIGQCCCISRILRWAGSNVAFAEEVAIQIVRDEDPNANIKLSAVD